MQVRRGTRCLALCGAMLMCGAVLAFAPGCGKSEKGLDEAELIRRFNHLHYDSNEWRHNSWLGVPSQQNPCDMWMMQEIISEVKPDVIVETGTMKGGSSLYFAMLLEQLNENGKVITVDINPQVEEALKHEIFRKRVEVIAGDSVSPETISRIAEQVKGRRCIVMLDSLHTKEHVLKELRLYSPFVSTNSYLIVQDTNINGHPAVPEYGPGPMEAVVEFMKDNKDFEIDRSRERQLLTYFPMGFLRRVR
jgi:cephalosporin hydroxylase